MIIRSAPINGGLPNGLVRGGVVLKSTTLNERNPLLVANKPVNTRPSPSKSVLTHPAPLPPASVGPSNPLWKAVAPKPSLDIKRVANGNWNFPVQFCYRLLTGICCRYRFVVEHAREFVSTRRHCIISAVCISGRIGSADSQRKRLEASGWRQSTSSAHGVHSYTGSIQLF